MPKALYIGPSYHCIYDGMHDLLTMDDEAFHE